MFFKKALLNNDLINILNGYIGNWIYRIYNTFEFKKNVSYRHTAVGYFLLILYIYIYNVRPSNVFCLFWHTMAASYPFPGSLPLLSGQRFLKETPGLSISQPVPSFRIPRSKDLSLPEVFEGGNLFFGGFAAFCFSGNLILFPASKGEGGIS